MTVENILPCPFCGGEAVFELIPAHNHTFSGMLTVGDTWTVECADCPAGFCGETKDEITALWNARHCYGCIEARVMPQAPPPPKATYDFNIPHYSCFVTGCPGNHPSKYGVCADVPPVEPTTVPGDPGFDRFLLGAVLSELNDSTEPSIIINWLTDELRRRDEKAKEALVEPKELYCTCPPSYPMQCGHHPDCNSQRVEEPGNDYMPSPDMVECPQCAGAGLISATLSKCARCAGNGIVEQPDEPTKPNYVSPEFATLAMGLECDACGKPDEHCARPYGICVRSPDETEGAKPCECINGKCLKQYMGLNEPMYFCRNERQQLNTGESQ